MAATTHIEWTDATWNPIVGCSVVSPGCTNCYAMRMAGTRLAHLPLYAGLTRPSKAGPVWTGVYRLNAAALIAPLRWRKPRRVFVNSMSDLFGEGVTDQMIDHVFAVMALTPQHTYQVLTKRPERMHKWILRAKIRAPALNEAIMRVGGAVATYDTPKYYAATRAACTSWPLPNLWLGISAEDQPRFDDRAPVLMATPAAVRFVSFEPLLGPIDARDALDSQRIDWAIVGGESGPGARPMHPDWVRNLRDQCADTSTAFFFKQWGEWGPEQVMGGRPLTFMRPDGSRGGFGSSTCAEMERRGKKAAGRQLDGRAHDAIPEPRR